MKLSTMARLWAAACERNPTREAWLVGLRRFEQAPFRDFFIFAGGRGEWGLDASNWRGGEASMLLCLLACLLEDEGH